MPYHSDFDHFLTEDGILIPSLSHVTVTSKTVPEGWLELSGVPLDKFVCKKKRGYQIPDIKSVVFNGQYTTILWADDTSTVVKCGNEEENEPYAGFAAAVCKKLFGSTSNAKRVMNEHDLNAIKAAKEEERQKRIEKQHAEEAAAHERKLLRQAKAIVAKRELERLADELEAKCLNGEESVG